jgi:hypothetical protein
MKVYSKQPTTNNKQETKQQHHKAHTQAKAKQSGV